MQYVPNCIYYCTAAARRKLIGFMATSGNIRELIEVSFGELKEIGQKRGASYVGSTVNLDGRADQHERDGYSGVMFYFRTKNMMRAEDELLEYPGVHNVYEWSGAQAKPGYVYVIKGRKYSLKRGWYRNYRRY